MTDIRTQGKGKNNTSETKRKSEKKEEIPTPVESDVKDKLHEELQLYCQFEDGTVDINMYQSVLKEISILPGRRMEKNTGLRTYSTSEYLTNGRVLPLES